MEETPIYLDHQATTPADPRVIAAMMPYFGEKFGNPHSLHHRLGREAEAAVAEARAELALLIGADAREIVFTSGATEANNLAIKGLGEFHGATRNHMVTCATEHKCVLESCARLERQGFNVTYLAVDAAGLIDLDALRSAIGERTLLVSVMAVNNEVGVIQPLAEIGEICRAAGVYFHTDAAQAAGRIAIDVDAMGIDLLSLSGHKMYGPKGIGALYVRRWPRVRLLPLFDGGGQERGLRSGTLAPPLCVGMGVAAAIARAEMVEEAARLAQLRDRFRDRLGAAIGACRVNGDRERRIAANLNLLIPGVDAEALVAGLGRVCISTGAACSSAAVEPSYVLRALGLTETEARASIRVGFGRATTAAEIDAAVAEIGAQVARLRAEAGGGNLAAETG